jgi:hypothetical protein
MMRPSNFVFSLLCFFGFPLILSLLFMPGAPAHGVIEVVGVWVLFGALISLGPLQLAIFYLPNSANLLLSAGAIAALEILQICALYFWSRTKLWAWWLQVMIAFFWSVIGILILFAGGLKCFTG